MAGIETHFWAGAKIKHQSFRPQVMHEYTLDNKRVRLFDAAMPFTPYHFERSGLVGLVIR